jgi:hypothetical protein
MPPSTAITAEPAPLPQLAPVGLIRPGFQLTYSNAEESLPRLPHLGTGPIPETLVGSAPWSVPPALLALAEPSLPARATFEPETAAAAVPAEVFPSQPDASPNQEGSVVRVLEAILQALKSLRDQQAPTWSGPLPSRSQLPPL